MDVASIERDTSEAILLGTRVVSDLGGKRAVNQVLKSDLVALVAVAYSELGAAKARKLMFKGLKLAEAMAAEDARP